MRRPQPKQACAPLDYCVVDWEEEKLKRAGCIGIYRDPADLLAKYEESPLG
jgi:hypothetical protein